MKLLKTYQHMMAGSHSMKDLKDSKDLLFKTPKVKAAPAFIGSKGPISREIEIHK